MVMKNNEHKITGLLALMMVVTPLMWVLSQPMAIIFIEICSLGVLLRAMYGRIYFSRLGRLQGLVIAGILVTAAFSLIPLPFEIWMRLPGRADYGNMIQLINGTSVGWRQISIVPRETEKALWLLLPPIMTYVAVSGLNRDAVKRLIMVVIILAVFQSVLGLIQYGAGVVSFNVLDRSAANVATGTYLNRDHLAGFLEMTFPVILSLAVALMGRHYFKVSPGAGLAGRGRYWASIEGNQAILYGLAAILVILCIIFTRSRMGILLTMIGLLLSLFAFSKRLGGNNIYGSYGTLLAVIIVLAIEIGLAPVLDRFSQDPMQDMRWEIYSTSMSGVGNFFPLGSGAGTFGQVYPAFQIPHHDFFINRAHNDYLEWFFTGGLPAVVLIMMVFYLYFRNWAQLWRSRQWDTFHFIQVGCGIGVLLMMLHSFVDFNLHKPMNAVYFAFFLAVFMRRDGNSAHLPESASPD